MLSKSITIRRSKQYIYVRVNEKGYLQSLV